MVGQKDEDAALLYKDSPETIPEDMTGNSDLASSGSGSTSAKRRRSRMQCSEDQPMAAGHAGDLQDDGQHPLLLYTSALTNPQTS